VNYEIVAGWTAPIDIELLTRGAAPTGTMAGMTVRLLLMSKTGDEIDTVGDVTIEDTDVWVVRYAPDPSDLHPGVYRMRIKVTDSGGKVVYFPSGDPDVLVVRPETY
jgi:hypothetical protein